MCFRSLIKYRPSPYSYFGSLKNMYKAITEAYIRGMYMRGPNYGGTIIIIQ